MKYVHIVVQPLILELSPHLNGNSAQQQPLPFSPAPQTPCPALLTTHPRLPVLAILHKQTHVLWLSITTWGLIHAVARVSVASPLGVGCGEAMWQTGTGGPFLKIMEQGTGGPGGLSWFSV